jgi:pseudouridine kinase
MAASNPGSVRVLPGGVGFNVASLLVRLGLDVALVARVGDDADGRLLLAAADAAGIEPTAIVTSPGARTACYHATLDHQGGLIIGIADMSICEELTPASIDAATRTTHDEIWLVDANLPQPTLAFIAESAMAAERPLVALSVSPAKAQRLAAIVERLSLVICNRREAAVVLGRVWTGVGPAAGELAAALVAAGSEAAIVTDSANPLAAAVRDEVRSFTPFPSAVASVNGAGDAFAGATVRALASGASLFEAILPGLAAAALTVESAETSRSDLSPKLIDAYLEKMQSAA